MVPRENYQLLVLQRRGERALVHLLRVLSSDGIRVIGIAWETEFRVPRFGVRNSDWGSTERGWPSQQFREWRA